MSRRLILSLVGLVALVLVVPSAAWIGSGKIAYSSYNVDTMSSSPTPGIWSRRTANEW